jgi:hypothetical protein
MQFQKAMNYHKATAFGKVKMKVSNLMDRLRGGSGDASKFAGDIR